MVFDPKDTEDACALWMEAPRTAALRNSALHRPGRGEALVKTLWSAISRGTERLVFEGRVPPSEFTRMRAPLQEGDFPFPVKYGYCAVGQVTAGPDDWRGRMVFCLHPHQERFVAPVSMLRPIPQKTPARRATLAANMETALNALWDSGAAPGDRITIIGAGVLGLLIAYLAARLPGSQTTVVDIDPARAPVARVIGAHFTAPHELDGTDADVVFHTSASQQGLVMALACAGQEAAIVEASWYGDAPIVAPLGGAFHAKRLRLISSQVGQVAPSHRARWSYARRLDKALELLADDRLDALITGEVAFIALPDRLPQILAADAPGLCTVVRY